MAPGMRAASAFFLASVAGAQKICADDSKFLPNARFASPSHDFGECSDWAARYAEDWEATTEICLSPVEAIIEGLPGSALMAVVDLQRALATNGCCEDRMSACSAVPLAECGGTHMHNGESYPVTESGGLCFPCYGVLMEKHGEKECAHCWGLDAAGCSQQQCSDLNLGVWDSEMQMCEGCNQWDYSGCDAEGCAALGGMQRCQDEGGEEPECRCAMCDTDGADIDGCSEEQCNEADDLNWKCYGSECRCSRCCLGGFDGVCYGHWTGCSEDQCVATEEVPDVNYIWWDHWEQNDDGEWEMVGKVGRCARCFSNGEDRDTAGCVTRDTCEAVDGFGWTCGDETGAHCCSECSEENMRGCASESSCSAVGGNYRCEHGMCECGKCCFEDHCGGNAMYCSQEQCTAEDATWMNYTAWENDEMMTKWGCMRCVRSEHHHDTRGCNTMDKCEAIEGNVWNCEGKTGDGGECCHRCWGDELWGCGTEQQCTNAEGDWIMEHGHGRCGKCCIDGYSADCHGSWEFCNHDTCTAPDAKMIPYTYWSHNEETQEWSEVNASKCRRCFNNGEQRNSEACMDKTECEAIHGGNWKCKDGESGTHCCAWCLDGDYGGCADKMKCIEAKGAWCATHNYCTHRDYIDDSCRTCASVSKSVIDSLHENRISPKLCD